MNRKTNKEIIFERMARLDPSFKPKLNESVYNEYNGVKISKPIKKKKASQLTKGDVTSQGAEIMWTNSQMMDVPKGKIAVVLKYPNKEPYKTYWNKQTLIGLRDDKEIVLSPEIKKLIDISIGDLGLNSLVDVTINPSDDYTKFFITNSEEKQKFLDYLKNNNYDFIENNIYSSVSVRV